MYLSIKAFHIISVVAWFAGLFYIFRLFVYHRQRQENKDICGLLSVMELRLLKYITVPASISVTLMGGALIYLNPALLSQSWLWIKLFLVLFLFVYQWLAFKTHVRFSRRDFYLSEKSCRIFNEVPTIFLIAIIFLAIHKYRI